MQDYGDLPPRGFPPLIGAGAWPDSVVDTCAFLLLLLAVALCVAAYRAGRKYERDGFERRFSRAPELIFAVVRRRIDIALMATGENIFSPVGKLIETIENHLGPVLRLSNDKLTLGDSVHKLKRALATEKKKVKEEHAAHGPTGGGTVIIATTPAASAVATASASVGATGVAIVEPARVIELPVQGGHGGHGGHAHGHHDEKEVTLSARERALTVREALEALSDYWQKERVIGDLRAAQTALMIDHVIGEPPLVPSRPVRERPGIERPVANPVEKAARDANRGIFPLFKF